MRVIKFNPLGVVQKIWDNPSKNILMTGIATTREEVYLLDQYHVQKFSSEGDVFVVDRDINRIVSFRIPPGNPG